MVAARLGVASAEGAHLHALQREGEAAGAEPRPLNPQRRRREASGTHGMHENRNAADARRPQTRGGVWEQKIPGL